MKASPLPPQLGRGFSVAEAKLLGVTPDRLRALDLQRPFHGVRVVGAEFPAPSTRFDAALKHELALIVALGRRLVEGQFIAGRSAALLWGVPMPHRNTPELHLGVFKPLRSPRVHGVIGHAFAPGRVALCETDGLPVLTPAYTFATLGQLPFLDLVAIGDFLARKYRPGVNRKNVGKPPLATLEELHRVVADGRWRGAPKLREALALIREDSWSPKESLTRVLLVQGGLPEPELNVDLFDRSGRFLACVDMLYRKYRVVVEYNGEQHGERYAEDVERIERLRAEGWAVVIVTKALVNQPWRLVARVAQELRKAGWPG